MPRAVLIEPRERKRTALLTCAVILLSSVSHALSLSLAVSFASHVPALCYLNFADVCNSRDVTDHWKDGPTILCKKCLQIDRRGFQSKVRVIQYILKGV